VYTVQIRPLADIVHSEYFIHLLIYLQKWQKNIVNCVRVVLLLSTLSPDT